MIVGPRRSFESASGLRPASAFVLVAFVLLAVCGKAIYIALLREGRQPQPKRSAEAPWPQFEITDRAGRPMALSVDSFDLSISPQSMWRSHTPLRIAERLSEHLDLEVSELLTRMLDLPDGSSGWALVEDPRLLSFSEPEALRVEHWLRTGGVGDDASGADGPIEGLQLARIGDDEWTLAWAPEQVLSETARRDHLGSRYAARPDVWTRHLLRDLQSLVDLQRLPDDLSERVARGERAATDEEIRAAIWAELVPSRFRVVRRGIDPITAHTIQLLLKEEAVSSWQMRMASGLARRSPVRPAADTPVEEARGAFDVVGRWGVLGTDDALAQAIRETSGSEGGSEGVAERARELATEWQPRSGLELLCVRELAQPYWDGLLDRGKRSYDRRLRVLPRDRRLAWDGEIPDYFLGASDAPDVPRFVSTVDAELQQLVHAQLRRTRDEHDAALVMAIVVEVESGAVLAVDAIHHYATSGFAPLQHVFTPGSTFKAVVMTTALDLGVVSPEEAFETFVADGFFVTDDAGHKRRIHEALGAPDAPFVTAETGLAESVNAVLVQIGLRIPSPVFRERLLRLGYGAAPSIGLGPEASGRVPPLENGAWKPCYTHASVSFGHEIGVTLWQHAAALATIARGGVFRRLHVIDRVEQGDRAWRLARTPDERVFSEDACHSVRAMMATAAEFGTGRSVANAAACPEFTYLGTKTGTTEKVSSELCLHVELAHNVTEHADGSPCLKACRATLAGQRAHHDHRSTCYTSSMCAVGRVAGDDRELMVLLVVDGPRAKAKYGADVAGSAAIAILRGAFGLAPTSGSLAEVTPPLPSRAFNPHDVPWAELSAQ